MFLDWVDTVRDGSENSSISFTTAATVLFAPFPRLLFYVFDLLHQKSTGDQPFTRTHVVIIRNFPLFQTEKCISNARFPVRPDQFFISFSSVLSPDKAIISSAMVPASA